MFLIKDWLRSVLFFFTAMGGVMCLCTGVWFAVLEPSQAPCELAYCLENTTPNCICAETNSTNCEPCINMLCVMELELHGGESYYYSQLDMGFPSTAKISPSRAIAAKNLAKAASVCYYHGKDKDDCYLTDASPRAYTVSFVLASFLLLVATTLVIQNCINVRSDPPPIPAHTGNCGWGNNSGCNVWNTRLFTAWITMFVMLIIIGTTMLPIYALPNIVATTCTITGNCTIIENFESKIPTARSINCPSVPATANGRNEGTYIAGGYFSTEIAEKLITTLYKIGKEHRCYYEKSNYARHYPYYGLSFASLELEVTAIIMLVVSCLCVVSIIVYLVVWRRFLRKRAQRDFIMYQGQMQQLNQQILLQNAHQLQQVQLNPPNVLLLNNQQIQINTNNTNNNNHNTTTNTTTQQQQEKSAKAKAIDDAWAKAFAAIEYAEKIDEKPLLFNEAQQNETLGADESQPPEALSVLCPICTERGRNTVLLFCGHVLCNVCAQQISECPFCKKQISFRKRIFLT